MSATETIRVPGDVVLESNERVLMATKPLALWLPVAILILVVWAFALYEWAAGATTVFSVAMLAAVAITVVAGLAWLRWRARWYILTDRRIITRAGVLNRVQSAILLERLQDVTLERPFPLSGFRGFGILRIESAGKDSEERIAMEHADSFHRSLTEALTPGR